MTMTQTMSALPDKWIPEPQNIEQGMSNDEVSAVDMPGKPREDTTESQRDDPMSAQGERSVALGK